MRSCLSTVGATVICSDVEPLSAFLCVCLQLVPLFKQKEVTAQQLVVKLWKEAEELRREKKRSTISGIHKSVII